MASEPASHINPNGLPTAAPDNYGGTARAGVHSAYATIISKTEHFEVFDEGGNPSLLWQIRVFARHDGAGDSSTDSHTNSEIKTWDGESVAFDGADYVSIHTRRRYRRIR